MSEDHMALRINSWDLGGWVVVVDSVPTGGDGIVRSRRVSASEARDAETRMVIRARPNTLRASFPLLPSPPVVDVTPTLPAVTNDGCFFLFRFSMRYNPTPHQAVLHHPPPPHPPWIQRWVWWGNRWNDSRRVPTSFYRGVGRV